MTTTWSAAGMSLVSPEATLVRAYFESTMIATDRRKSEAFPGYVEFLGAQTGKVLEDDPKRPHPWAGTRRLFVQSLSVEGAELRAVVCDDRAGMYRQEWAGRPLESVVGRSPSHYGPGGRPYMDSAMTWFVSMRRTGVTGTWPSDVDKGSARAPNWKSSEAGR
ncbi:hypothetical protein [Gordonia sp. DT101]|uniref:hypothetical protein n=1 Tax=Gordonia sp. DT101 TaxID=3416545 RepID=UPI003CE9666C